MRKVRDVMSDELVSCQPDSTLEEVAKLMSYQNVGLIPVCDLEHHLMGVVTDRDLVLRGYAKGVSHNEHVDSVMTQDVISCDQDSTVVEASELMADHQIRRLPVVEDRKLIGIISLGDLALEQQSNHAAGEALEDISKRPHHH